MTPPSSELLCIRDEYVTTRHATRLAGIALLVLGAASLVVVTTTAQAPGNVEMLTFLAILGAMLSVLGLLLSADIRTYRIEIEPGLNRLRKYVSVGHVPLILCNQITTDSLNDRLEIKESLYYKDPGLTSTRVSGVLLELRAVTKHRTFLLCRHFDYAVDETRTAAELHARRIADCLGLPLGS